MIFHPLVKFNRPAPPFCFFSHFKWTPNVFWMFILHASCLVGSGYGVHRVLIIYKHGKKRFSCSGTVRKTSFFSRHETQRSQLEQRKYTSHKIHGTGIYLYIYHKNQLNVGKYTIHGWYGVWWVVNSRYYVLIYMYTFGYISRMPIPSIIHFWPTKNAQSCCDIHV